MRKNTRKSLIRGGIPVMEHPENKLDKEDKISICKDYARKQYLCLIAERDNLTEHVKLANRKFTICAIRFPYLVGYFKAISKLWESCFNEQNRHEIARKGLKSIYDSIK